MSLVFEAPAIYEPDEQNSYREEVRRQLDRAWKRTAHVIIPYPKYLGFQAANGTEYIFSVDDDGNLAFGAEVETPVSLASVSMVVEVSGDVASVTAEVSAARQGEANLSAKITLVNTAAVNAGSAAATAQSEITAARDGEASLLAKVNSIDTAIVNEAGARASADTAIIAAYQSADTSLQASITTNATAITNEASARASADTAITAAYQAADTTISASVTTNASAIASINGAAAFYEVIVAAGGGDPAIVRLKAGAAGSEVSLSGRKIQLLNALGSGVVGGLTLEGGSAKLTGTLHVGAGITVGAAQLKVGLESIKKEAEDGDSITWAAGVSIGNVPDYALDTSGLAPLATGEQYSVYLTSVTATGASVNARINTPGATTPQSETTDAGGGGGDPDRVMHKPTSADSYNATYTFTISGEVDVVSFPNAEVPGDFIHSGLATFSTWFDDGGGWVEGPSIAVPAYMVVGFTSGADETGLHAFSLSFDIAWGDAIGQHGGEEFGVSYESGGSLTEIVEIAYTTQSTSGDRSATPSGEKLRITAFPRNA